MNTNDVATLTSAKFNWDNIDYDIGYLRIESGLAVPKCETCPHVAHCDCNISCCLEYGVIELRVVVCNPVAST